MKNSNKLRIRQKARMSRTGKRSSSGAEHVCACIHASAPFILLLFGGYVYYTRVKWLHASDPLISPIHHRVAEKKSNNIACTATFTRVHAREIARSPVPRDDPQTYGSTRSSSILEKIREIRADGKKRDERGRMWNEENFERISTKLTVNVG